jgi:hypothetical protein
LEGPRISLARPQQLRRVSGQVDDRAGLEPAVAGIQYQVDGMSDSFFYVAAIRQWRFFARQL